jgi:hypothetical protein
MKIVLLIAISIISKHSLAQMDTIPFATDSMTLSKAGFYQVTFPASTKLNARFDCSTGFTGYTFIFGTNNKYFIRGFSCSGFDSLDNGTWNIKSNRDIILESKKGKSVYQVYKLDDLYFLVAIQEAEKFKSDIHNRIRKYAYRKPVILDKKLYTVNHIIGESLIDKYFIMEPQEE